MNYYISNTNEMTCIPLTIGVIGEMVSNLFKMLDLNNILDKLRNVSNETIVLFTIIMMTFVFVMLFKINLLIIDEMNYKIEVLNKEIEAKNETISSLKKKPVTRSLTPPPIRIDLTDL